MILLLGVNNENSCTWYVVCEIEILVYKNGIQNYVFTSVSNALVTIEGNKI